MRRYELHSSLPPAKLRDKLDLEVRVQNSLHKKACKVALNWKKENRFTACRMNYGSISGTYGAVGAEHRRVFLSAGVGEGKSVGFSPVYCGQIAPNEAGSVISGYFRQPLWGWAVIVGGVYGLGLISCAAAGQYWIYVIVLILGIPMLRDFLFPERTKSAGELWDALECLIETVDGLAAEELKQKKDEQIEE